MTLEFIRCARASFRVVTFGVLELGRDRIRGIVFLSGFLGGVDSGLALDSDSVSESSSITITGGIWFSLTDEVLSVGLFVFLVICCRRVLLLSRRCCFRRGETRGEERAVESLDRSDRELEFEGLLLSTRLRPFLRGVSR